MYLRYLVQDCNMTTIKWHSNVTEGADVTTNREYKETDQYHQPAKTRRLDFQRR